MNVEQRSALSLRIVLLVSCSVAAAGFAAAIPWLWHDKLYIDGLTIVQAYPELKPFGSSFAASAYLLSPILDAMRAMGLALDSYGLLINDDLFIINCLFGGMFLLGIGLFALGWRLRADTPSTVSFFAFVVLFAPFYFCITKEWIPFAMTFVALLGYRCGVTGIRGTLAFYAIALLVCGLFFRTYYMACAVLMVFNMALWRRRRWLLAGYLVSAVLLVFMHDSLPLELINKGRASYLQNVSASRIEYYFDDGSGMGFLANRALTLGMLLLPVNLLAVSLSYVPFVVVQVYLTIKMAGELLRPRSDIRTMAAAAILSFTSVSALYEPDFGSYFRHKVGVMLFMLLLVTEYDWRPTKKAK